MNGTTPLDNATVDYTTYTATSSDGGAFAAVTYSPVPPSILSQVTADPLTTLKSLNQRYEASLHAVSGATTNTTETFGGAPAAFSRFEVPPRSSAGSSSPPGSAAGGNGTVETVAFFTRQTIYSITVGYQSGDPDPQFKALIRSFQLTS